MHEQVEVLYDRYGIVRRVILDGVDMKCVSASVEMDIDSLPLLTMSVHVKNVDWRINEKEKRPVP